MPFTPWAAGERITAARLNQVSPTWATWVPAWTTSTGAASPSFGNASIIARYSQDADVVTCRLEIVFGSTTSFGGGGGSDNWRFSLPVTAAGTQLIMGYGEVQDSATGGSPSSARYGMRPRVTTTTTMELETSTGSTTGSANVSVGLIDAVTPFTWANTDAIRVWAMYEAG